MPIKNPEGSPILQRTLEILGDQAINIHTLAYRVGCERTTLLVFAQKGVLAKVGRHRVPGSGARGGLTILCAPQFAEQHRERFRQEKGRAA
jgi:hypothetical protein